MQHRLDIDDVVRRLAELYERYGFANKKIACGKIALAILYGIIVFGTCLGIVSGLLTGAESIFWHALDYSFVSALLANFLAIVWIAVVRSPRAPRVVVTSERAAPETPPAAISVCLQPSFRPPRASA